MNLLAFTFSCIAVRCRGRSAGGQAPWWAEKGLDAGSTFSKLFRYLISRAPG